MSYGGRSSEGSARMAGMLKEKGIEPGDRVGVMLPNVPYFPVAYYGVLRAGGVVVPMNVLLKGREVRFYLEDPGAKLLVAWGDFAEAAEKGAEEAGVECILVKPGEFEQLLGAAEPDHGGGRPRRRGHRGDPLHVGHHRQAQGRRADPRQPAASNCTVAGEHAGRDRRGRHAARRAAAVPLASARPAR